MGFYFEALSQVTEGCRALVYIFKTWWIKISNLNSLSSTPLVSRGSVFIGAERILKNLALNHQMNCKAYLIEILSFRQKYFALYITKSFLGVDLTLEKRLTHILLFYVS